MKAGNKRRILALLLTAAMLLTLLPMSALAADGEEITYDGQFVVMSTTDVHGKVWDLNLLNDTNVNNSLLNVATAVSAARESYGEENVMVLDNGDLYQGTPVSSYNINLYTQGLTTMMNPMALALEYIGYDASILGNHEFNYSWSTMSDIYQHLNDNGVPTLACNIYYKTSGERVMQPYMTKTFTVGDQEFTVGVIGLENTDCTRWDVPDNYPDMCFSSPENPSLDVTWEVNKCIEEMKEEGIECDYLIVSYHSGLGSTGDDLVYGTNTENQVLRIVANCPEVDMIVAGHDHSTSYSNTYYKANGDGTASQCCETGKAGEVEEPEEGSVLIVNGGNTSMTETVFNVHYSSESGISISLDDSQNLNLANYSKDEALKTIIQPYADQASEYVNQSVGILADNWEETFGSYSNNKYYLQQSDTIDLINRTQIYEGTYYLNQKYDSVDALNEKLREIYGEDTAKQYSGDTIQVDMSSTSIVSSQATVGGELSMKGIYGFYKYDNSLYIITMTGQEIKDLLEYNASNRLTARVASGEVTYGTTGDSFTNPVFYGLNFTYDMAQDEGNRAVIEGFSNGKEFKLDETYIFCINNYHLGNAGNAELGKYSTADAIWSQTDDLGGGYVQDLISSYVGTMTSKYGEVYGTAECEKNGETASHWSISYSGDTTAVVVADDTAYIGKAVTGLTDGDQIFFYCPYAGGTLGLASGYNGRAVATGTASDDTGYGSVGTAVFTVAEVDGGFTLQCESGYLNSTGRNNLSYVETAGENSVWTVETIEGSSNIYLKNVKNSVYLETYSGAITTYSGRKNDQYVFGMYSLVTSAAMTDPADLQEGDNVVIYYNDGATVLGAPSGSKLSAVAADTVDTKNSKIMEVPDGANIFTIEIDENGNYLFKNDSGYLTSGQTGNSLSFAATASDLSRWTFEEANGGWYIHNVGANYNGNYNQYLEYYNGFTTYGMSSSKKNLYIYNIFTVGAVGTEKEAEPIQGYVLPVFETSDIHGYLLDTSSGNEDTYQYRLAYIADDVNDARDGDNSNVVLVDTGDIYQGNTVSNLQNGQPMAAAFDAMDYDVVSIGNHEFDWGVETVIDEDGTMPAYAVGDYVGDSQIPVVCANMTKDGEHISFAQDYVILEKTATDAEGNEITVKIGVIGYVEEYSADIMAAQFSEAGYEVTLDADIVENLAEKLETELDCDATILLTHAGATKVASSLSADTRIDLVCGGHTHVTQAGETSTGISYIQPANQAVAYGYAELVFETDENGECTGVVSTNDVKTVAVTDDKTALYDTEANADNLDQTVVDIAKQSVAEIYDVLHEELGYITTGATTGAIGSNSSSSTAGNWMTSLMARSVDAEVAFTNNGGIRTSFPIPDGQEYRTITASDIYTISPFCNAIYKYELTYAELLEVLEYSQAGGRSLGLRMSGIDCYLSNGTVNALVMNGELIYQNGEWVDDWAEKTVTVATNEYVATSNTPFKTWNSTDKLVSFDTVDNEGAIAALKEEAAASGGYLYVDPNPHFINGTYDADAAAEEHVCTWLTLEFDDYTIDICEQCGNYVVTPKVTEMPFTDVKEGRYYYNAVEWGWQNKIAKGTTATTFSPNADCTRADIITFIWRAEGEPGATIDSVPFTDVSKSAYYYKALLWAYENGIAKGTSSTTFAPNGSCTRSEAITFLWRAANKPAATIDSVPFTDVKSGKFYWNALLWCYENSIVKGTSSTTFEPGSNCVRGMIITLIYRLYATK